MARSTNPRGPGRPALGRTEPLGREEILARAEQILREDGRDALSMRRLAADLGVTPMALYHHVQDKSALVAAVIERVWTQITVARSPREDPLEYLVEYCVEVRRVWLANFELASLAVGVAEPDEQFVRATRFSMMIFASAGFPDVPLAYSAVQNFTMGCVEVAANRRVASAYFGRDPDAVRREAMERLAAHDATADHIGVVNARFDEGDELHFEASLRALIRGLLDAAPRGDGGGESPPPSSTGRTLRRN